MNSTSIETTARTDETHSKQLIKMEKSEPGFSIDMKQKPLIALSPNATGIITVEEIRSPRLPKIGSSSKVKTTPQRMIF
jgi:hypothetical protein